ncbi:protein serine/threonine phosphatase 2C [Rhizoclosmatium globosum]|uniref:Protein serine/threonine phosphatase 2C n=1 Tax=Rhizoclosmatium globosum TaxID=329046 RepID=A0A1Y2CWP1_9FUNG|nr:protein serine/threonine phosphatase 2C [Rhizoclosmatium globosum]|eukprot:ORY51453.1 protein serine/threonine phosphatase 2C [Rhizoclosmatium globosum]
MLSRVFPRATNIRRHLSAGFSTQPTNPKPKSNLFLVASGLCLCGVSAALLMPSQPPNSKALSTKAASVGGSGLTSDEADAVLKRFERSLLPQLPSTVVRCDFAAVASNDPIEDYHSEQRCQHGQLFAVMDGHGGTECAAIVQKYLGAYVANALDAALAGKKDWLGRRQQAPVAENTTDADGPDPVRKEAITKALISAFTRLDEDIVNGGFDVVLGPEDVTTADIIRKHLRPALAGSCTLLAYVDGNDVYVACTGDSRAVIGRRKLEGVWEAIDMSADQTVRNVQEYNRLLEEHPGEIETVVVKGRVLGGLMPTRAFGDSRYKWPTQLSEVLLPHVTNRNPPKNYLTPPYVTAKPVVTHYRITPSRDLFLVLATDGLYDELSSQEVVTVVSGFLQHHQIAAPPTVEWGSDPLANKALSLTKDTNAATCLIRNALGGSNEDKTRKLLGIPAPYSRRFRDDMTVNVLFFDHDNTAPPNGLDKARLIVDAQNVQKGLEEVNLNLASAKQHRLQSWTSYFVNLEKQTGIKSKL